MVKPFRHPRYAEHPEESSYHKRASILKNFEDQKELPIALLNRVERYKSSIDLANVFIENRAILHKTCINKCDQQKLERKRKRTNLQQESDSKSPQKMTRRSLSAHNFTKSCYFCEGHDGGGPTRVSNLAG